MSQSRFFTIVSVILLSLSCSHESEPPASGADADADARAPSATEGVMENTAGNFGAGLGGTTGRAGETPDQSGGSMSMAGTGGGVGRTPTPGTIGTTP